MVYTDNAGNVFLGDAIYSAGTGRLTSFPFTNLSNELNSLCLNSGLKFRLIASQTLIDQFYTSEPNRIILLFFGSQNDIDDRYSFCFANSGGFNSNAAIHLYNQNGGVGTNNTIGVAGGDVATNSITALVSRDGSLSAFWNGTTSSPTSYSAPVGITGADFFEVAGVSDGNSLGLFFYSYDQNTLQLRTSFYYAGILDAINPDYAYYNTSVETYSILIHGTRTTHSGSNLNLKIAHRIANLGKIALETGDAQYPIVCSDGQTPTSQWATDFYVFDNNATLGYPAIGKVRNLLLAQGTYTMGKPVKIQGSVVPDNGSLYYLPVGTFAGKTVLMRCFSSVDI